jgi:uncharacterized protein with HEPN domain
MKDDLLYIGHMLDSARKAQSFIHDQSREDYDQDEPLRLALAHLLQIIGEAARRVSESFWIAHPEIPWQAIIGMRHKVVHDYLYVDEDIVWKTATEDLPLLISELAKLVPPDAE